VREEEYAVEIERTREILQYQPLTRVPATPPAIRGVMNLRGQVVPVVDLAVKFGLGETEISRWTCVVMVDVRVGDETLVMGMLVDAVREVIDLAASDIAPPPSFGTQLGGAYLLGLGMLKQKPVLLLAIDRVLGDGELAATTGAIAAESR
jgi:purine-binding chemotaxis protein CheW